MKNLINKFYFLDRVTKTGLLFVFTFIVPFLGLIIYNLIINGSKL